MITTAKIPKVSKTKTHIHATIKQKIQLATIKYVYSQLIIALLASLFCASIVYIGLFSNNNKTLNIWASIFLLITVARVISVIVYYLDKNREKHIKMWRNFYNLGSLLGGSSWGLAGILLLPHVTPNQQMLLILMLAGVTAGAVQLSSAVLLSAILFLVSSLLPFIITILTIKHQILYLFDTTMMLYLLYSILFSIKSHRLIKNSIKLTFQNDALLKDLENMNVMLEQAATHDPLTTVANRRLFELTLNRIINKAKNNQTQFALLYFDLDHFKEINDDYGHEAGDYVLLTVTKRLKKVFREKDVIARLGGDEFATIIENSDKEMLASVAKKICLEIAKPIIWADRPLHISISIGIAIYPDDGKIEEELLHNSDQCMYVAKAKGGNTFEFSSELRQAKNDVETLM